MDVSVQLRRRGRHAPAVGAGVLLLLLLSVEGLLSVLAGLR